jgi:NADH-ubiquinone oxidoreductase chain 5
VAPVANEKDKMYLTIVFLPLIGATIAGFFGRYVGSRGASLITAILVSTSAILSLVAVYEVGLSGSPCYIHLTSWIDSEMLDANWGFMFDSLTASMLVVVNGVSALVHIYSIGYMSGDPHRPRFMAYLSFFTFFMLMLITADNFIQMFLGWEGVGLCSYLLINFWYTRIQANKAAMKAMIVNRIGDFGFALGIIAIFYLFKSVDFGTVFALVPLMSEEKLIFSLFSCEYELHYLTVVCLLLFVGAIGKSAQIGLHTWLPDAMEGPTPVSALIHAATMVTAGVFMVIRCSPIFEYAPTALVVVTIMGAMTAFFAATTGLFQNDLKKVIAYSTCSQLGYMIFACGLSNYSVSMFHLMNHAFFKALLFLSAGSVIHALADEQDMRKMGGLLSLIPFTYVMMLIGSMSLMGFPFLTGFYSKDVILELAFAKFTFEGTFAHWLGCVSALFTAFYSFRLIYLTFIGTVNGIRVNYSNVHESPPTMAIPLFILSLGSIFIGYLTRDMVLGLGTNYWGNAICILPQNMIMIDSEFIPYEIKLVPVMLSMLGAISAILLYHFQIAFVYTSSIGRNIAVFLNKKWLFDKVYNDFFAPVCLHFGYRISYKTIDKGVIELFGPFGISNLMTRLSKRISSLQSGLLYHYAFFIILGVTLFLMLMSSSSILYLMLGLDKLDLSLFFIFFVGSLFF